jgi:hypothetical protein
MACSLCLVLTTVCFLHVVLVNNNISCSASNNYRDTNPYLAFIEDGTHGELGCPQERMISAGSGQHADFVDDNEDDTRSEDSTNEHGEVSLCVAGAGADDEGILSPCQQVYEDSGNDKKVLFLMCIGLNHNDAPLFSFDMLPWSKLPKSSLVRPKNTDFGIEIDRRAKVYNILPIPRPRNWSRKSTMEWLQVNPVRDPRDIEFLTKEVLRLHDILERAQLRHKKQLLPNQIQAV